MKKKIINLTQHPASAEQIEAGVIDLPKESGLSLALTFNELPTKETIQNRANLITGIAMMNGATHAMIGGAPFLMSALEHTLKEKDIVPLYAFSQRISVEKTTETGEVIKTSIFQHKGFVEV